MKDNNQERLQKKLKEIETQLKSDSPLKPTPELSNSLKSLYEQVLIWYKGLPTWGKGGTMIVGLMLSLSVFRTVLNLINLGMTLAVIGVGGYFAYKLFLASESSNIKK
ncbi:MULTISPECIES: hypothetical protein [Planktothricoides]|uniref:Uncharacterized protein n=2 Tax=Planktothricoides raciborskii TaxID=132608 RepID=A0AAU8JKR9_9CYAN|nr:MULTISPECIES: hypothetical protein [Planktothricoides]KOR36635.1 hypothetical protein AM228_11875 [Planktothricoides sp. SR001]MBD2546078.1 hypothetical protein [Planktothricoides raciborskii FACHB-1370]MBD2584336.1 hypothetical protein [Planktothricoides raciborskii FACHB-1261]